MFYHDHAYGLTRLNVYTGDAAGCVITDPVEQTLVNSRTVPGTSIVVPAGTIPADQIPLIIQDKTFVPRETQLAVQDPTWNSANTYKNQLRIQPNRGTARALESEAISRRSWQVTRVGRNLK